MNNDLREQVQRIIDTYYASMEANPDELITLIRTASLDAYDNATIDIDIKVREQIDSHFSESDNLTNADVKGIAIQASNLTRLLHRKAIDNLRGNDE